MADDKQIKSKKRVREQGEVFTAEREVNAMLDLEKPETERIDSRFLEPACGNGNFMVKILERKLAVVEGRMKNPYEDWKCNATQALSSIYGIDIMMDNVVECRQRMMTIMTDWYAKVNKKRPVEPDLKKTWEYILRRNVLFGDALTLCEPTEDKRPIVFSEWGFIGMSVCRRDYTLDVLLKPDNNLKDENGNNVKMPKPLQEFKLKKYTKLYTQEDETIDPIQSRRVDLFGQPI